MSHFIDSETPCHEEVMGEQVWQDAIAEEYQYILKLCMRYCSETKREVCDDFQEDL
jgi:hypothetical protein